MPRLNASHDPSDCPDLGATPEPGLPIREAAADLACLSSRDISVDEFAAMVDDFGLSGSALSLNSGGLAEVAYLASMEIDDLFYSLDGRYEICAEMMAGGIEVDATDGSVLAEVRD